MDAGLNTPFEGYQSIGTIPPLFWLRENLNNGVERIFSSRLANGSAAERKNGIVFGPSIQPYVGGYSFRLAPLRKTSDAYTLLNSHVQVPSSSSHPRPWSSSQRLSSALFFQSTMKAYFKKKRHRRQRFVGSGAFSTSVSSFALP
jgi:hypothetical protein